MKTKNKRNIIWSLISVFTVLSLAIIVVPPMITLNFLKPKIENVIFNKTGVFAQIKGNINFSLIGHTTIVAHNIIIPNGTISSCSFDIPTMDLFDLQKAEISGNITVRGASLHINHVTPFNLNTPITLKDSDIKFLNKEYKVIHADLSKTNSTVIVRTDQHKYEIKSTGKYFTVQNKNNDLYMSGQLFDDGTANARIDITAQNINRWFEFQNPKITGHFPITADLEWNGSYGINFYNISADGVTGTINLQEDGYKDIKLQSKNSDFDVSFFITNPKLLQTSSFDLDFYGKIKFLDKTFKHLHMQTKGSNQEVTIKEIIADEMKIVGGTIDKNGAHNVSVSLPENSVNTTCIFNGTPNDWYCEHFSYGDALSGNLNVTRNTFVINLLSKEQIQDIKSIVNSAKKFGNIGIVNFVFPDMAGTIKINQDNYTIEYEYAKNKNLAWANIDLRIPESLLNENGNFVWEKDTMIFIPDSQTWRLSLNKDFFIIHGDGFKKWLPNINLDSFNDLPFVISGNHKNGNISNLSLEIDGQMFKGSFINKQITIKTNSLNLDKFISQDYINNYERLSFFDEHPLTIPFDLGVNIALSAQDLILNNQTYNNFVYSLKPNIQTFSISDSDRGNMLASIQKNNIKYAIDIQLNKFVLSRPLFKTLMPLNISDTTITGDIQLKTYGKIAHDVIDNLNGTFDISFNGGKLYGIGIDDFYASAPSITTLNVEYILPTALSTGVSNLKKLHIIGTYKSGDIQTTQPFTLSLKHTDAFGTLDIINNEMTTKLKLTLRGTSAGPEPIDLTIFPDGGREYSLSEIMMHFDPEYMRSFVKSHNQF